MLSTNKSPVWPKKVLELSSDQKKAKEAFLKIWLEQLPQKYSMIERFNQHYITRLPLDSGTKTLEIGAGLGEHAKYEDLMKQEYYMLESREDFCAHLRQNFRSDRVFCSDIQKKQHWPDGYFDRIIAIHVLEHLPNLPATLSEVHRLLKPTGCFDVVLPCEGGLLYSFARAISAEPLFKKNFKMDYTPIIKSEHINTLPEIMTEIRQKFHSQKTRFFPFFVPFYQMNLVVALRLFKKD